MRGRFPSNLARAVTTRKASTSNMHSRFFSFLLAAALAPPLASAEFEWAGSVELPVGSYSLRFQKVGCPLLEAAYADPEMAIALISLTNTSAAALTAASSNAESLIQAPTQMVTAGQMFPLDTGVTLVFDQSALDSLYPFTIITAGPYGLYTAHVPTEFERDAHFLIDADNGDIEFFATLTEDGEEGHGHGHDNTCDEIPESNPDCECTVAGLVNCRDMDRVVTNFNLLVENECNVGCNCYDNPVCQDAYFIVESYHSGCNANAIPQNIEEGIHDFEPFCQHCYIAPYQTPGLVSCGVVDCENQAAVLDQWNFLNEASNGCSLDNCQSAACEAAWNAVVAHHDSCCDADIPEVIETGFHVFEDICLGGCNIEFNRTYVVNCDAEKNAPFLPASSGGDDDDDQMSAGAMAGISIAVAIVFCAIVFACVYKFCLKPSVVDKARSGPSPLHDTSSAQFNEGSTAGSTGV